MKRIGILVLSLIICFSCSNDDDNEGEIKESNAKEITSFAFLAADNDILSEDVEAEVDHEERTVTIALPPRTNITGLKPTIALSDKATMNPKEKIA